MASLGGGLKWSSSGALVNQKLKYDFLLSSSIYMYVIERTMTNKIGGSEKNSHNDGELAKREIGVTGSFVAIITTLTCIFIFVVNFRCK